MKTQTTGVLFALLLSLILFSTVVKAQIVYTDIPDTTLSTSSVFSIDLDHDGNADFNFSATTSNVTAVQCSGSHHNINYWINPENGSMILRNTNNNKPKTLTYESIIDSGSVIWNDSSTNMISNVWICALSPFTLQWAWRNSTISLSIPLNFSTYLGVKFYIGSQIHYGWIRLYLSGNPQTPTIQDYAYNANPEEPINAGANYDYCYDILWSKCYGSLLTDFSNYIDKTSDGGFIVCGSVYADSGDVIGYHSLQDAWIIKLDSSGNLQWQKCLGGSDDDQFLFVHQTTDLGFIIAGTSESNDFDVSGHHGAITFSDGWIVKLDSSGNLIWQRSLGGSNNDYLYSIAETPDGGYITSGFTYSNDGDVTGLHGTINSDGWIVKLDSSGSIGWQKCLGGSSSESIRSIYLTPGGGYVAGGSTSSNDFDVSGNHGGGDCWILNLDSNGSILSQKCFGGSGSESLMSMTRTADGGFAFTSSTNSVDGDVTGNHGSGNDFWIAKADSNNILQFEKCMGGSSSEIPHSIIQTIDGGFAVNGVARSMDGDVLDNHTTGTVAQDDCWVVKLDSSGNTEWTRALGGTQSESGSGIIQCMNGDFVMSGYAASVDGNVTLGNQRGGYPDFWTVKFHPRNVTTYQSPVICQGTNFTVGGNAYDSTGIYTDTLSQVTGCDSIVVTILTVNVCTKINDLPANFSDIQIIPNPLLNSSVISISLSVPENILIRIYDVNGKFVKTIAKQNLTGGVNKFTWNGDDENGNYVVSGIYFVRFENEKYFSLKKIVVMH